MNILLINHYAGSPYHGMEFRPYYLAREWVRQGHKVRILAGSYSHIRAKQPELLNNKIKDEVIDGVEYIWYPVSPYAGNGLGRVYSMISFLTHLWMNAKSVANDFRPDFVIASSTYPMDIWPAKKIAKFSNAKLVYEVHDLWPLSPIELGGMSKRHPFIRWVQLAEDYAYRRSDKVVSMLPKALPYMKSRGLKDEKFFYVPNGVDEDEWENPSALPDDILKTLKNIKEKGRPIVGYAGTHGLANALDDLLNASLSLVDKVEVVLVGTGPEREKLIERVKQENLKNVHMLPSVPKTAIPSLLDYFDIAYIGLQSQPLFRFGISPNKLMDYMYAGKPVVMAIDAGNDPVSDSGCGLSVHAGDVNAISGAILKLASLTDAERSCMGGLGRNFIVANQTYSKLASKFIDAMKC